MGIIQLCPAQFPPWALHSFPSTNNIWEHLSLQTQQKSVYTMFGIFAKLIAVFQDLVIKTNFLFQEEKQFLSPKCLHQKEAHWCYYQTLNPPFIQKAPFLWKWRGEKSLSEVHMAEGLIGSSQLILHLLLKHL